MNLWIKYWFTTIYGEIKQESATGLPVLHSHVYLRRYFVCTNKNSFYTRSLLSEDDRFFVIYYSLFYVWCCVMPFISICILWLIYHIAWWIAKWLLTLRFFIFKERKMMLGKCTLSIPALSFQEQKIQRRWYKESIKCNSWSCLLNIFVTFTKLPLLIWSVSIPWRSLL